MKPNLLIAVYGDPAQIDQFITTVATETYAPIGNPPSGARVSCADGSFIHLLLPDTKNKLKDALLGDRESPVAHSIGHVVLVDSSRPELLWRRKLEIVDNIFSTPKVVGVQQSDVLTFDSIKEMLFPKGDFPNAFPIQILEYDIQNPSSVRDVLFALAEVIYEDYEDWFGPIPDEPD